MNIFVVIPAYNEGERVEFVIQELLGVGLNNIIVVDDGSINSIDHLQTKFPIILTEHVENLGQGAALKTGTELAIELGADIIAHIDADGQHRIQDLLKLIKYLKENNDYQVAIGSRFLDNSTKLPAKKKLILGLAKIFSQKLLMLNFSDPQSGLRVFTSKVFPKLYWQNDDFSHCSEILSRIGRNKIQFKELPIKVNYSDQTNPENKSISPQISMGWKLLKDKILDKI
jgi:polyprenyl-phospho-N-acetylgalactosaminyl synthase